MSQTAVFIITHGDLAFSFKAVIEKIMGQQENVFTFTNKVDSLPVLMEKIMHQRKQCAAEHIVVFTDLVGGSCWTLANMLIKKDPQVVAVGGVNLPMLVSFFTNCGKLPFQDLITKIVADGNRGIVVQQGGSS